MDRQDLRTRLQGLLEEEMGEAYPTLADEADLKDGLGLDSVDVVGLVMRVERELRIRLSLPELQGVRTVGQLLDLLEAKLAEPPPVSAAA
jgi:acyl carrier protein